MTAGIETLKLLKKRGFYDELTEKTETLAKGIEDVGRKRGVDVQVARLGSMFTVFFTDKVVKNYKGAKACDHKRFAEYFTKMLKHGVFLPPSQYEANFVGLAHTKGDIKKTLEAMDKVFKGF
jgi:glutamate-1-semialdehyde 2,1-aminomutase